MLLSLRSNPQTMSVMTWQNNQVIIYILFSFLFSWTYYVEENAGKCHITSVISHMMGHMISVGK